MPIACVFIGILAVHCYYQFVECVFPTLRCDRKADHVVARRYLERFDKTPDDWEATPTFEVVEGRLDDDVERQSTTSPKTAL